MKRFLSIPEAGIFTILIVLTIMFTALNPIFISLGNVQAMMRASAFTGIVAIGLSLCLISGTIDISVGAIAGLASVMFAKGLVDYGLSTISAAVLSVLIGLCCGWVNSMVIVRLKVSPFIATISAMYVYRGLANFASKGYTVYPLPPNITAFGSLQPLGLSWPFIIMVFIMVIVAIILATTVWGLCVRATGSDLEAAECTEVNVKAIQTSTLMIAGGLAALAGVMITCVLGAGTPTAGTGYELFAICAAAIGGVSLFGFSGSMVGLFAGMMVIQVILNGIVTAGISPYFQSVCIGILLVFSMVLDVRRRYVLNLEKL